MDLDLLSLSVERVRGRDEVPSRVPHLLRRARFLLWLYCVCVEVLLPMVPTRHLVGLTLVVFILLLQLVVSDQDVVVMLLLMDTHDFVVNALLDFLGVPVTALSDQDVGLKDRAAALLLSRRIVVLLGGDHSRHDLQQSLLVTVVVVSASCCEHLSALQILLVALALDR